MFTFTITPDGAEPFEVKAGSRDVYVWERSGQNRTLSGFLENLNMSDLYRIAHLAARRQQLTELGLDDFAATCDLDFEEDDPGADPTRPGASQGGS